jgi:hypothetical protein
MVDLYPSENLNAWNLLSVRNFVYKLLFHVHLQKTARCESLQALLPYVEWDRFVTLAGRKSGLRVTLSYLPLSHLIPKLTLQSTVLLPNNDLLQQFEDYVIELRCEKGRRKEKNTIRNKFKNMYIAGSEFKNERIVQRVQRYMHCYL